MLSTSHARSCLACHRLELRHALRSHSQERYPNKCCCSLYSMNALLCALAGVCCHVCNALMQKGCLLLNEGLFLLFCVLYAAGGMANIIVDPDSICHGVLHRVTQPEFAVLQEIESNYATVQVPVVPYKPFSVDSNNISAADHVAAAKPPSAVAATGTGPACAPAGPEADDSTDTDSGAKVVLGSPVTATAFIVHPAGLAAMAQQHPEWGNSLPSDRYIRIITEGLRHYGADPAWFDKIAAEPCKHGRQPHEYLKLPAPDAGCQAGDSSSNGSGSSDGSAQLRQFTMQQLAQYEGKLQDGKAIFAVGGKVAELDVSSKPDGPMVAILQKHYAGRQVAFHMCMMLQEPRLPPISTPADLRQEHIEWAEDMIMDFTAGYGFGPRQIGWLEGQGMPDGGVDAAAAQAAVIKDAAEALHEEDEATTAPESGVWR